MRSKSAEEPKDSGELDAFKLGEPDYWDSEELDDWVSDESSDIESAEEREPPNADWLPIPFSSFDKAVRILVLSLVIVGIITIFVIPSGGIRFCIVFGIIFVVALATPSFGIMQDPSNMYKTRFVKWWAPEEYGIKPPAKKSLNSKAGLKSTLRYCMWEAIVTAVSSLLVYFVKNAKFQYFVTFSFLTITTALVIAFISSLFSGLKAR